MAGSALALNRGALRRSPLISRKTQGDVRILLMSHGKANALDIEFLDALTSELRAVGSDADVRAAVLTGGGSIFCAGVDLKRVVDGGEPYVRAFLPALERALEAAFSCEKPLVAAINGHAIAGGYILACATDRRIMADGNARVGLPELHVGVPFPTLVLEILRATVAANRLQELLLVGGTQPPAAALAAGLIDEVLPADQLREAACATAQRLGSLSPAAYATTKRKLRAPAIAAWRAQASDGDAAIVEQWCETGTLDAIRRFVEKTLR